MSRDADRDHSVIGGVRALAAQPLWRRWTLASFLARLPTTMTLIALLFAGQQATGSLAVGAQLAGVATVVTGLSATWRGRRLDRVGLRAGLRRACLATAVVFLAQALAVTLHAPIALLALLAAAQGVTGAGLGGGYRALLVPVVSARDLPRANSLDAVLVEVAFVTGPALAGALVLLVGPAGVLLVMAAAVGSAGLVTAGLPTLHPLRDHAGPPPWRLPGTRPVYGLAVLLGVCLGLFESTMPARVAELGLEAASAGPLLSLVAAGSGLGGLLVSARIHRADPGRLAVALLAGLGALMVPSAMTRSPWLLGCVLFLVGLPIAPLNALGTLQLQRTIPGGRQAEGFALFLAAVLVGAGLGNTLTGGLLDDLGPAALLATAAALPATAGVLLLAALLLTTGHRRRPEQDPGSRVPPGRVLASGRHRHRSDRR